MRFQGDEMVIQVQFVLYNTPIDAIRKSVSSFCNSAAQNGIDIEIAIGNASKDDYCPEEREALLEATQDTPIKYTFFNKNTGYGQGHNLLARESKSDLLLFCNPDLIVGAPFFHEMLKPFIGNTETGIVEARQSPIEHPKEYSIETGETEWASGACMGIWTDLFLRLGGFDDKTFFMYAEDVDLSWRVRLAGYRVIYQPRAVAYHPKKLDHEGCWSPSYAEEYHSTESMMLLAYKWHDEKHLKRLFEDARNGGAAQRDALCAFQERVQLGNLPEQIIQGEGIASFYPEGRVAEHRFAL